MLPIYSHNWYNRNKVTFVYGNPTSLTNVYSSTLYTENQTADLLNNYDKLAKELSNLIYVRFGKKLPFVISDTADTSYTDGKKIVIANNFNTASNFERLDILMALAFHEAAHCLYTDFNLLESKHVSLNFVLKHIHNILEDEEIENRMCKQAVGYSKFFAKLKANILDNNGCGEAAVKEDKTNQLDEILSIFFCLVRYPKYIELFSNDVLEKYQDLFIKINDILTNNFCPAVIPFTNCSLPEDSFYDSKNITSTTCSAAFEIYKYLVDYIQEDFEKEAKECQEDENSFANKVNNGFGVVPIPGSAAENMPNHTHDFEDVFQFRHEELNLSNTNGLNCVEIKNTLVRSENRDTYNKMFNLINPYIDIAKRSIIVNNTEYKDRLEINRFRRNGSLDSRRLADAMQNINTVYQQRLIGREKVKSNAKYAFVVMIDESGSMKTNDGRDLFAHSISVLFAEVFDKFKDIEYYVYGHGDYINPYLTKEQKNKFVLGNYDYQGGQNDAVAYSKIINDVKRQTNLPIVILNITDFYYCAKEKELIKVLDSFKKNNVSFNMLNVGNYHNERQRYICEKLLDGQVVDCNNVCNNEIIKETITKISEMIKKNYDKYNK